jgi:protein tyrosine phosphatase
MEMEPTHPSTPPASTPLPSFHMQTLEDIHKKLTQLKEYESSVCPFPASTFCHPVAFKRDRYYSIRPWAHNRVELLGVRNLEHPYIKASRIDLGRKNEEFIATHGPLEDEFGRFWRLVWQEKSEVIVMLTQPSEKGVEKCAVYYPESLTRS